MNALTVSMTAFAVVFLVYYLMGRQDYPGQYKRPILGAIKPAVIAACVVGGVAGVFTY